MKQYYRPSAASLGRKRTRRKRPLNLSFLKPVLLLAVLAFFVFAAYVAFSKIYVALSASGVSAWQPKEAVVLGVEGAFKRELSTLAQSKLGKPFSVKDAVDLRTDIVKKYPMLTDVSVKRGLLGGALKISATRRVPVAKFVLPNGTVRFIDSDSVVYADPNPDKLLSVPFVELEGKVPEKLSAEVVDLVKSALSLSKNLNFSFLRFNLTKNTVKMYMPDGSIVDFGAARKLKQKAARAAQVIAWLRENQPGARYVDFTFFDDGKIFSRQISN